MICWGLYVGYEVEFLEFEDFWENKERIYILRLRDFWRKLKVEFVLLKLDFFKINNSRYGVLLIL